MSAVVVMGEAPESEEEIDDYNSNPPETPPSPSPDFQQQVQLKDGSSTLQQHLPQTSPSFTQNESKSIKTPSTTTFNPDTLLHRKLREKNELFREELVKMACQPFLKGTKEINSLSQQLIKSQTMVQQVSDTLSKLTRDLKNVDLTLDSLINHQQQPVIKRIPNDTLLSSSSTST